MMLQRLMKLGEVMNVTALKTTKIYKDVKEGLFPPPIKLTMRASAWVEQEVAAVNRARIAGKTDAEIRELVARLVAARVASCEIGAAS